MAENSGTRVLVCGGRDYDHDEKVFAVLNHYTTGYDFTTVIHGCARGADCAAGRWAALGGVEECKFPANWKKHGRAAGPIRNEAMIRIGKPDVVIAFPGGRGTKNMVDLARAAGIEIIEVES